MGGSAVRLIIMIAYCIFRLELRMIEPGLPENVCMPSRHAARWTKDPLPGCRLSAIINTCGVIQTKYDAVGTRCIILRYKYRTGKPVVVTGPGSCKKSQQRSSCPYKRVLAPAPACNCKKKSAQGLWYLDANSNMASSGEVGRKKPKISFLYADQGCNEGSGDSVS